jgi:hypothetical protein
MRALVVAFVLAVGASTGDASGASGAGTWTVRLRAKPAKGWKLRSWSGACKGSRTTCTVPMSAVTKARATFVRA